MLMVIGVKCSLTNWSHRRRWRTSPRRFRTRCSSPGGRKFIALGRSQPRREGSNQKRCSRSEKNSSHVASPTFWGMCCRKCRTLYTPRLQDFFSCYCGELLSLPAPQSLTAFQLGGNPWFRSNRDVGFCSNEPRPDLEQLEWYKTGQDNMGPGICYPHFLLRRCTHSGYARRSIPRYGRADSLSHKPCRIHAPVTVGGPLQR